MVRAILRSRSGTTIRPQVPEEWNTESHLLRLRLVRKAGHRGGLTAWIAFRALVTTDSFDRVFGGEYDISLCQMPRVKNRHCEGGRLRGWRSLSRFSGPRASATRLGSVAFLEIGCRHNTRRPPPERKVWMCLLTRYLRHKHGQHERFRPRTSFCLTPSFKLVSSHAL